MGLTAADDPGLLLLPIHRLVESSVPLEDVIRQLPPHFDVEPVFSLDQMLELMAERGKLVTAVGMVSADSPDMYVLSGYGRDDIASLLPPEAPPEWLNVDAAVLQYAILMHVLAIKEADIVAGEMVEYTEDAAKAVKAVREGKFRYAFFLNPVRPAQVLDIADSGQRMPQKSTYFYPKLPTGLVIRPFRY